MKVKNCSDSKLLPLAGNCDILKQYCQFIEIVEQNFNSVFPRHSFKKAIEAAKSFYANGVSVEIIAKPLKLTQEQVLQIVKK